MSYTYEKVSSNKAKLTITIPAEQFDEAMQKAYVKNRGKINVPGFRKGKAPRKMIETLYGEAVFYDDAFDMLVPEEYDAAVKAEGLKVVDRPSIDIEEIGSGKDMKVVCEVFVRPDVTLGDYKGLSVEIEKKAVTDADIDARIEQDRQKAARTIEVDDRPVENGDTVKLDYSGTVDGVKFEGGTAENQTLTIGSNQFIPGFEEQMIGMSIGEEKDLNVTFPAEYHAEDLKGKAAVFHVKVNGISKTEMPELDDDFAADVSDFDTFAAYRENIVKTLNEEAEKANEIAAENALVDKACENAQVDIPNAMIEEELDYMMRDMEMRMAYSGLRMEDYLKYTGQTKDQMRSMYRAEATTRVKSQLVLEAIRKAENVEPTEEEIKAQTEEQAKRAGQEIEEFEKNLTDDQRDYLKESAAIQKTIDLMKKDAVITEKKEEAPAEAAETAETK